jgi:hypothetical protein
MGRLLQPQIHERLGRRCTPGIPRISLVEKFDQVFVVLADDLRENVKTASGEHP